MRTITSSGFAHRVISALRAAVPSHSAEEQKKSACVRASPSSSSARTPRRRLSWERLRRAGSKSSSHREVSPADSKTSESSTFSPTASLELGNLHIKDSCAVQQQTICKTHSTDSEVSAIANEEQAETHQELARPPTPPTRAPIAFKHHSSPDGEIAAAGTEDMPRPRPNRRGVRFSSQPDIVISYEADDTFASSGPRRAVTKPKNVHANFIRAAPQSHSDLSSAFDLLDNYVATRPSSV